MIFNGMNVIVSPMLPLHPGHGESARRIVRHGLADVLEWLGEAPGPEPDELTHIIAGCDGPVTMLMVSAEVYGRLRDEA